MSSNDMADNRTNNGAPISVGGDLSTNPYTEKVVDKEPPSYVFVNPLSNNTNNVDPSTVQYQPQRQWIGMQENVTNAPQRYGVPIMVNPELNNIENYKCWSILNIIFCCFWLGLAACYYSCETENSILRGNLQGALNASRKARTMNIIATVVGTIIFVIIVIYYIVAVMYIASKY